MQNASRRDFLVGAGAAAILSGCHNWGSVLRTQTAELLAQARAKKINILYINHDRADRSVPLGVTRVELDVETRNAQHAKEVADTLRKAGYKIEMR